MCGALASPSSLSSFPLVLDAGCAILGVLLLHRLDDRGRTSRQRLQWFGGFKQQGCGRVASRMRWVLHGRVHDAIASRCQRVARTARNEGQLFGITK